MGTRVLYVVIPLLIFLVGCRYNPIPEKEEAIYWHSQVIDSAASVLYAREQLEPALALFDSLVLQQETTSPYIAISRHLMIAHYHYFISGNNETLSHYIDSALQLIQKEKLKTRYPRMYVGLLLFGGEIAFKLYNYNKANNYYFLAKQSADLYLDPCERSTFTYNIAMVSFRQQNYQQSASYFKEAYAAQSTCPVQTTAIVLQQQEILSNIGLCLIKLNEYDSAFYFFDQAWQLATNYRDSLGPQTMDKIKGVLAGNRGKIYLATNQLTAAEKQYQESIKLNDRPQGEERDAMLVKLQLADVYNRQQRNKEMLALLQQVRDRLDSAPDAEAETEWRRLMFTYYKNVGIPEQELQYFKSFVALRDSTAQKHKQMLQADITRQIKEKEQDFQITVLEKNNQLNTIYMWVALALSAMAAIIMMLVFQNYRRTKKNVAALTALNQQINQQKGALEKANREKDRILQVVAHDLRTPVGLSAYVADLALMEEPSQKEHHYLQMIKEASQQALYLINELLGLQSKDKTPSAIESTELVGLLQNAVQMLQFKAAEKGQHIKLQTAEATIMVNGNAEKINRVVNNLINNAIKFSPLQGTISVKLEKKENDVLLSVTNKGKEIPHHQLQTVFERFTTARTRGTSGEKSFGLGLSICKELVENMGGTIQLESSAITGTTFYVTLPSTNNV